MGTLKTETIIHSNGSTWHGQRHKTIDELIEVLKTEIIEERFFSRYSVKTSPLTVEYRNHCPISENNGMTHFFGNFEALSHVFRIDTNDKKIITKLTKAIKKNEGWEKYYSTNIIK